MLNQAFKVCVPVGAIRLTDDALGEMEKPKV